MCRRITRAGFQAGGHTPKGRKGFMEMGDMEHSSLTLHVVAYTQNDM